MWIPAILAVTELRRRANAVRSTAENGVGAHVGIASFPKFALAVRQAGNSRSARVMRSNGDEAVHGSRNKVAIEPLNTIRVNTASGAT